MNNEKIPNEKDASQKKLISFLCAVCLFLSAIENAIPKPLPFLRLGLANLPIILSLFLLPYRKILLLVIFKIVAQAIISGSLFSYIFLFSASSSFSSAIFMILVYALSKKLTNESFFSISAIGISLIGSLASTFAQLLLSRFFLFGSNTRYVAPILLISGLITGLILGIFAELFMQNSVWFKQVKGLPKA